MTQIACDLYPLWGFTLMPDSPPVTPPTLPEIRLPGSGEARPIRQDVFFVMLARRSSAELAPFPFGSRHAAERFAKNAKHDPDVMASEVVCLTTKRKRAQVHLPLNGEVQRPLKQHHETRRGTVFLHPSLS